MNKFLAGIKNLLQALPKRDEMKSVCQKDFHGTSVSARQFLPDLAISPQRPIGASMPELQPRHITLGPRPEISVVLGSLDRIELLKIALESVRREVSGLEAEIIVIDGGSADGAREWLTKQHDVITVIQHNRFVVDGEKMRRRSWGGFMNIAFRAARSDNILMISDDCCLLPGAVKAGLERIRAAREARLKVGGCAFYFRNWPAEPRYYVQRTLGGNMMVNHGLYSKQALEDIGFANEDDYVFYKADTDLSLRLWRAGYAIIDSPASVCEHYVGIAEALRESNNAVMEYDREQMRRFWPELVDGETVRKMGKIELDLEPGDGVETLWRPLREAEQRRLDREGAAEGGAPARTGPLGSRRTAAKPKPAGERAARGESETNKTAASGARAARRKKGVTTKRKPGRAAAKTADAGTTKAAGTSNAKHATHSNENPDSPPSKTPAKRRSRKTPSPKTAGGDATKAQLKP